MEETDKYRLFDAYLRGELSDDEMEEFTASLESDPDLETELEIYKSIISGIRESRRNELKEFLYSRTKMRTGFLGNNWSRPFLYASAAILIIFIAAFFVVEYYFPQDQKVSEALENSAPQQAEEKPEEQFFKEKPEPAKESTITPVETIVLADNTLTKEMTEIEVPQKTEAFHDTVSIMPEAVMEKSVSRIKEEIEYADINEQEEEKENSFPVLKDSKYADTILNVQFISSRINATPKMKSKITSIDSSRFQDSGQVKKTEINRLPSQKIQIEFWESPVDYTGYKFDGNRLLLYGFPSSEVKLKALPKNEQLNIWQYFLQSGDKVYELAEGENFKPYKELTDRNLLQRIGK